MRRNLGYVILRKDQWDNVREIAERNLYLSLHPEGPSDRVFIIRDEDDLLVADLGSIPSQDYYWMSFSLTDEGCSLLREALLIDDEEYLH